MKSLKLMIFAFAASASPAAAKGAPLIALRAQDARLLRVAEPILAANVRLCDRTMPDLGVLLQSNDQYPPDELPGFAAPVGFADVLPDSAAAQAGIEHGDGLLSVDGSRIAEQSADAAGPLRDSAFAAIAEHDPSKPLQLGIVHRGESRDVTIPVKQECRILAQIVDSDRETAEADDRVIALSYGLAAKANDEQMAVIFAHELAHAILHHSERRAAAGVSGGLLGQLGRNRRLNLQTEEDADRLSVYLLANAGLDPHAAPDFWRSSLGRHLSGGIFHNQAHPSAKARAKMMEAEIAEHIRPGQPSFPAALLATRDEPLK